MQRQIAAVGGSDSRCIKARVGLPSGELAQHPGKGRLRLEDAHAQSARPGRASPIRLVAFDELRKPRA
eukprot:scaffold62248_cov63-Phaeocystis_antarctica.AAC.3